MAKSYDRVHEILLPVDPDHVARRVERASLIRFLKESSFDIGPCAGSRIVEGGKIEVFPE